MPDEVLLRSFDGDASHTVMVLVEPERRLGFVVARSEPEIEILGDVDFAGNVRETLLPPAVEAPK